MNLIKIIVPKDLIIMLNIKCFEESPSMGAFIFV